MEFDNKENRYLRAKERVAYIKKFYTSLFFYLIFIGFLAGLNWYTNELRYPWFLWAAVGWGIGLVFQAARAYKWAPYMNKDWEERKIKEFMDKEDKSSTSNRWS